MRLWARVSLVKTTTGQQLPLSACTLKTPAIVLLSPPPLSGDNNYRAAVYRIFLPTPPPGAPKNAGVEGLAVGDRVGYTTRTVSQTTPVGGSYAEFTAVKAAYVAKLPGSVSTQDAAAVMLQGLTAWSQATVAVANEIKPGELRPVPGTKCVVHVPARGSVLTIACCLVWPSSASLASCLAMAHGSAVASKQGFFRRQDITSSHSVQPVLTAI